MGERLETAGRGPRLVSMLAKGVELCLRCGAEMVWRHSSWQCPKCRWKLGCCEGECPND